MSGNLSIRYENLKITLEKSLKDCDYTLGDLKNLCRRYIPDEVERNGIESVGKLLDTLQDKGDLSVKDVSILEVLAEELKLQDLEEKVQKYKWNHLIGFSGKALKVGAQAPGTCLRVLKGGTNATVIILNTGFKTAAQTAAITVTVAAIMKLFDNNPEVLQNLFSNYILPYAMNLIGLKKGSLYFVLETSSLSSLKQLWTSYKDGSLKEKLKKVINEIDEVRKLTKGTEIDVTVEIDEAEYREACWVLMLAEIEQAEVEQESSKKFQRPRRHSLSCEREFLPMRNKTQISWQEWPPLKEAENKRVNKTRRRKYVEKRVEELREEMEVHNGVKDTTESKEDNIMLILENIENLKKDIENSEEILKSAVEANDQNWVGATYYKTGVLYYALGILYKKTNEKENGEDTMKKAESCFREAADSWEKLNAQLNDEDELKSEVKHSLSKIYEFLTTVLIDAKKTEEALIVSDRTRDSGLVDTMIKKFQMNEIEILNESMRYANVLSILENKNFSILIFSGRQNINIWTLEYQKPSFFLESELKTSVETYVTNLDGFSDQETLEQLYELLIAPVLPNLTQDDDHDHDHDDNEVVIIADGPLQLVPFAALQNPETGQFLSEIKSIRYAPSLTAMKVWKECPVDYHGNTGALVVGDPDVGRVMIAGERCAALTRLPFAQREAVIVGNKLDVRPLIGAQATKDEVLKRLQDCLAVIHIAARGNHRGDILLAPSAPTREVIPGEHDCLLTIEEVQEMRIRAQLVVLSFSGSGRGKITMGKVDSMSRAFLAAGARAVVASLWDIHDEATLSFMVSFYMYLRMETSASKSLQYAMNDTRGNYEDPRHWAPFFLIGDDVTLSV